MALNIENILLHGFTGSIGRQFVLRFRKGKTVICKMPKPYTKPPTQGQLANRERFKKANDFAKAVLADPVKKAYYQSRAKGGQTAYNMAFSEAFHGADAVETNISADQKKMTVSLRPKHNTEKVKVTVLHPAGFETESAQAQVNALGSGWNYHFKESPVGKLIRMTVTNKAGVSWSREFYFAGS